MPRVTSLGWILGALLGASGLMAAPARADLLLLEDGRVLERDGMSRVEGGIKVPFENGDVIVPDRMIETAILSSEPAFVPTTPEEEAKVERGLVPYEGRWVKPAQRDKLIAKRIAERKAQIAEIRERSVWRNRWQEETKHFEFETTVPPHVFEHFRDLMEAYYKAFAKDWKISQPREFGKLKVCFYTDIASFHQTGGVGGGVQGYFRFVKPLELNFYYDRLDPEHTEQVLYHEANHYLQLLMNVEFNMPHFPGESIAEYYGSSRFDPKTGRIETGLVLESRLTEIKTDVLADEMMGLERMIKADGMYEHYNWGWSLVHFLMNDRTRRKQFTKFVKELVHGKNVTRRPANPGMTTVAPADVWVLFCDVFKLDSPEAVTALEAQWHVYVKENLQFVTSRGLEKAALSAMQSNMPIKAGRLFREAIEAGSENPTTYQRYGELLGRKGKWAEAVPYLRKAVEFGPLEPSFYATLGRALRSSGEEEEGLKVFRLALELDPDNPWLELEFKDLWEDKDAE